LQYLLTLGNELRGARLGLERIDALLDRLARPERAFRSVHVAGTNGKGSTAAMIEAGLRAAGFRTGLFTSPHLLRINERIQTAGREISDDDFCAAFDEVRAAIERLLAEEALDAHPTYFECLTAMAFCHFRRAGVEVAVVEVGLGGRLDATNVLAPAVTVITPIDFDHETYLGRGEASIAAEKAGILKPGVPAVFAPQHPGTRSVLESRAREIGTPVAPLPSASQLRHRDGFYQFQAGRVNAKLALAGEHQVTNALVAIAALELLGVAPAAIEQGLRNARWPGRLETVAENPQVLLDGAHNPGGARVLARFIERHHAGRRLWLLYGAMRDKAVDEVAGILFPLAHRVLLTPITQPRAVSAASLAEIVAHHHPRVEITSGLIEALALARSQAAPTDIILVTGSLYLVGEAKVLCSGKSSAPSSGPTR